MLVKKKSNSGVELQDRDYTSLTGLFESRVMLRAHFIALYFADQPEYGKKRIKRLVEGKFLAERKPEKTRGQFLPSILYLTRKGLEALEAKCAIIEMHGLSWDELVRRMDVAASTLYHELENMELKVAMTKALRLRAGFVLEEYTTWPRLCEFKTVHLETGARIVLKPDAYIEIHESGDEDVAEHRFFHEHDRSTEERRHLAVKAHGYDYYYRKGGLAVRNGMDAAQYKQFPFRVLFTFLNEERRNNAAERLLKEPHLLKQQFLLSTIDEYLRSPLQPIWMSLKDYAQATAQTMYDPQVYTADRRVSARDKVVAAGFTKQSLFDS